MRISLLGIAPALLTACTMGKTQKEDQPNIIMFLVDDMGWQDTAVPFADSVTARNRIFHTPNMERLAGQGVMMTNAYAAPVSTPSRTSLMTGMNPAHSRITSWTSTLRDTPSDFDSETNNLVTPEWNMNGMSPEPGIPLTSYATPLPRLLRDAGYFPIHVGKAHWASAGTPAASPYNLGFVVNVTGTVAGMPTSYLSEDHYGNKPGMWDYWAVQNMTEYYDTGTHLTDALTHEALKALEYPISKGEPFFLYMSHYAVHTPVQADGRFVQKYLDLGYEQTEANFASLVEGMDKSLGDIMDFLEQKDIAENTVIIFMSDNGGNSVSYQKGSHLHVQNLPLREGKGSVYEGGIRVPMMVKWSGKVQPGTRNETPVVIEDFFASLLDIAGTPDVTCVQNVDGVSFIPHITGNSEPEERPLVFHYPHKWKKADHRDIDYLTAIRTGDWKLIYRMQTGELELYNLRQDIGETIDLAADDPEKVREMAGLLSEKLRAWDAQMPTYKHDGKPVPYPDEVLGSN